MGPMWQSVAFSLCDFTAACEDHLWLVSAVLWAHSNLGAMSMYRNERPSFYTSAQGAGLFQADMGHWKAFLSLFGWIRLSGLFF